MAHTNQFHLEFSFSPQVPPSTKVYLSPSPDKLMQSGYNIPVTVSVPSSQKTKDNSDGISSVTTMALFDTGASRTSIGTKLASYLGLIPIGMSPSLTAAGIMQTPDYAVNISFPGTELSSFINLPVGSCNLPLQIAEDGSIPVIPNNFGLLLGRDIMARWNIVWNGPTSTVFISD